MITEDISYSKVDHIEGQETIEVNKRSKKKKLIDGLPSGGGTIISHVLNCGWYIK